MGDGPPPAGAIRAIRGTRTTARSASFTAIPAAKLAGMATMPEGMSDSATATVTMNPTTDAIDGSSVSWVA